MTKVIGNIDKVQNGIVEGWVAVEDLSNVQIFHGEQSLGSIEELVLRQDVINAGHFEGNAGFKLDTKGVLSNVLGLQKFSIRVNNEIIREKEVYIFENYNFVLNPFIELKNHSSLKNISINTSYKTGIHIDRFIASPELKNSNGSYTRIAFDDKNNSKIPLKIDIELDKNILKSDKNKPLELVIVARSSIASNLHVVLKNEQNKSVYDEPILFDQGWLTKRIVLGHELSAGLRTGKLNLQLKTKHYGRRHIDISMIALVEDFFKFKSSTQGFRASIQDENRTKEIEDSIFQRNLINNGELEQWPNTKEFPRLKRGQELARNWFIEMSKTNVGNVQISAITDNIRRDTLAKGSVEKFGLQASTKELDGYARLLCALNVSSINEVDYELLIDIEAASENAKTVLPRLYFIPRSSNDEKRVIEISRKIPIMGRQTLTFKLSAYRMNQIITKTEGMPVLALAIELPNLSKINVYSVSLKATSKLELTDDEVSNEAIQGLSFEDKTIIEQLHLLKGLNSWTSDKPIIPKTKDIEVDCRTSQRFSNDFNDIIRSLTPHNMLVPARKFPFIDVIVPVYNACDDVLLCLSSLVEKTDLLHRVVIINDGDDKRTEELLQTFDSSYNHIEVLNNPVNIGYTRSVNKGIKHSNADWVVVLNSDTIVSEGWLGKLMNCALATDKVGMVGPLSNAASWQSIPHIVDKNGDWHLNPLPDGLTIDGFAEIIEKHSIRAYPQVGVINGFCQLISMDLLDEIGLLDEVAFPIGYGEENDMCARAVKADYKLLIADDTYVFHAKSKSFGHEQRKKLAKQGSKALKEKHPDVDWGQITKLFRENIELTELRNNILSELEQFENGEI